MRLEDMLLYLGMNVPLSEGLVGMGNQRYQKGIFEIMSNHVIKYFTYVITIVVLSVLAFYGIDANNSRLKAQDNDSSMSLLLENLDSDGIPFVLNFVTPVSNESTAWLLPSDIEDEGNVLGHRQVREISDEYICVDQIGQGATDVFCIPFSNVAFISYNPRS
jgi:hypothetical protein